MSVLLGVILMFAALTLTMAVVQAVAIVRVAPASENLAGFMPLGWWKFHRLTAKAGPAAAQPLTIYKRAVIAFLVFLLLGLVLSGWSVSRSPAASADTAFTFADPISVAQFKTLRRAATMPGNSIVES